ncbi:MAG: TraR/DksA family transcriptional regulator [Gammaproteobacteria bacterium]
MPLSDDEKAHFRTMLEKRREDLDSEIDEGVETRETTERFSAIASDNPDPGDASVGAEQVDLRNAQIDRDVVELQQVNAALQRMDDGTYGLCIDCGGEIGAARLEANPSAERCIHCQEAYEKRHATQATPSL